MIIYEQLLIRVVFFDATGAVAKICSSLKPRPSEAQSYKTLSRLFRSLTPNLIKNVAE